MRDQEEVVISGIAGRYPESENIDEFWSKLLAGVDLVTEDARRYPMGKLFVFVLFPHVFEPICVLSAGNRISGLAITDGQAEATRPV